MEENNDISNYGIVTKKETLKSYTGSESLKDLILEASEPFPGYYCMDMPTENNCKPVSYFFILKPGPICNEDNIIRVTQKIKKEKNYEFDACPGHLTLFNNVQPHVRIQTKNHTLIPELAEEFKANGIVLQKNKKVKAFTSMIRIKKYFELEYISEGVYKSMDEPCFKYIRIQKEISWKDFEAITLTIKNTYNFKNYDYALAAIYQKCGLEDYVRIYSEHCDCEKLPVLRQKYIDEIDKHIF